MPDMFWGPLTDRDVVKLLKKGQITGLDPKMEKRLVTLIADISEKSYHSGMDHNDKHGRPGFGY